MTMSSTRDVVWRELAELSSYHLQTGWLLARWLEKHPVRGPVLDVGCGTMPFRGLFGQEIPWYGVDTAAPARAAAPVVIGRMERLPFCDGAFSMVLSTFSLHHGRDPGVSLREMRRILAEDGMLVLTVPSNMYLAYRLPLWLCPPNLVVRKAFDRSTLGRLMEDAGFESIVADRCGGLLCQLYEHVLSSLSKAQVRPSRAIEDNCATAKPAPWNRKTLRRYATRLLAAAEHFSGARALGSGIWFAAATRRGHP